MHALHLPSRHLVLTGIAALVLALLFVLATDLFSTIELSLFSGGVGANADVATPPPTWATDPLTPPTVLLTR